MSGQQAEGGSSPRARSALIRVIEGEIIPRLFLAHRNRPLRRLSGRGQDGLSGDSQDFAQLFLRGDTAQIVSQLRVFTACGIRRDRLYLDVLGPVSKALAVLWSEGRCSFEDMAAGLACIDRVLHEIDADDAADHD